jgi:hypothetical protein
MLPLSPKRRIGGEICVDALLCFAPLGLGFQSSGASSCARGPVCSDCRVGPGRRRSNGRLHRSRGNVFPFCSLCSSDFAFRAFEFRIEQRARNASGLSDGSASHVTVRVGGAR